MNKKAIDALWIAHHTVWVDGDHVMDKQGLAQSIAEYDAALRDAIKKKADGFAFTPADRRTIKYIIRNTEVQP